MTPDTAQRLYEFFLRQGYTWKIDGKQTAPTKNDLQKVLDEARDMLYAEPVPSQLEVGRLIIRRWGEDKFDIYLHIGSHNKENIND